MLKLRRSRDAVVRALENLRAHGFLDWLRRYEPTGNKGCGPQVKQASNAYRMSLPNGARQVLGRWGVAPPPPDDHMQAELERAAAINAHRASLDIESRTLFDVGDNALGKALARLGKAIFLRESARQTESLSSYIIHKRE